MEQELPCSIFFSSLLAAKVDELIDARSDSAGEHLDIFR
jgi:hypothetical protein